MKNISRVNNSYNIVEEIFDYERLFDDPDLKINATNADVHQEASFAKNLIPFPVIICLLVYKIFWLRKCIRKCCGKFEPGHIFLINILCDNILHLVAAFIMNLVRNENLFEQNVCKRVFTFFLFFECLRLSSPFASEIDRSLALYWNLLYKERVTNQIAIVIIFANKSIVILLQSIYFLKYNDFSCPTLNRMALNAESNFPIFILLELTYGLVTIASCSYVFHVAKKSQNIVIPINLNPNIENQENEESKENYLLKMSKIGVKVNKISILQLTATVPVFLAQIYILVADEKT